MDELSRNEIVKAGNDFIRFIESRAEENYSSVELIKKAIDVICGNEVNIQERGWAGHFIGSHWCRFRRNTLITKGEKHVVVSTVGNYHPRDCTETSEVGVGRYYETMVFEGRQYGEYIDIDVERELSEYFDGLYYKSPQDIPDNVDNLADDMHEAIVASVVKAMNDNTLPSPRKPYDDED